MQRGVAGELKSFEALGCWWCMGVRSVRLWIWVFASRIVEGTIVLHFAMLDNLIDFGSVEPILFSSCTILAFTVRYGV